MLKAEVGMTVEDDGIFFMSADDYVKHFNETSVCKYYANHVHSTIRVKNSMETALVKVVITES